MANGETHALAEVIAAFVRTRGLAKQYGGQVVETKNHNDKFYLSIGWSVFGKVNGEVCVYHPQFIIFKWIEPRREWQRERFETADQVIDALRPWAGEPDYGDQMALPIEEETDDFDRLVAASAPIYPESELL